MARERPLPRVVVLFLGKLSQDIRRITAAAISKPAQLIHVTPLARALDELVDCVLVTVCGPHPQVCQVMISHARYLSSGSAATSGPTAT
jgi:hypothetical protein